MLPISLRRICQSLSAAISDDVKRVPLALRMLRYVLHFHQSSDTLTVRPHCPAARNAFRNQISSLVKSLVIRGFEVE
jgi:hypothetical protein